MEKDCTVARVIILKGVMSEQYLSLYGSLPSSDDGGKSSLETTTNEWDAGNAWYVNVNNGNANYNNKANANPVRVVAAYQEDVYKSPISFFRAALSCDRNKRSSLDCIEFSMNSSDSIVKLWRDCISFTYEPSASDVFIVPYPVKREVFGAAYCDRIVHHYKTGHSRLLYVYRQRHFVVDV